MGIEWFGTGTNLLLVCTVVAFGVHWLRKDSHQNWFAFRWRAYRCWWASWVCWVLAWGAILWRDIYGKSQTHLQVVPAFDVPILILDNLNTFCLILMYFAVTRGNKFDRRALIRVALQMLFPFTMGLAVMYLIFPFALAFEIHRAYALAASVFVPVLVGWAFNLRFGNQLVLIVGFVYGFIQPVVYKAVVPAAQSGAAIAVTAPVQQAITMVVAFLKVIWAIVCTRVLSAAYSEGEEIFHPHHTRPFKFWNRWPWPVALQAGLLSCAYLVALVWLMSSYGRDYHTVLEPVALGIGVVGGAIGLLDFVSRVIRHLRGRI